MNNLKKIIVSLILIALIPIPTIVNAAVEYSLNYPSNDGTIEININNLQLDENKQYEFSLVNKGGTPTDWFLITDFTTSTAKIDLSAGTKEISDILKVSDNGQIFIREKGNTESYILDRFNVNLKLPYLKAVNYEKYVYDSYQIHTLYGAIGGWLTGNSYYKFEKVTDKNFINEFLKDKNNTERLENLLPNPPDKDYTEQGTSISTSNYNDGLYILWIRMTGTNCKTIQGAIIHDGLPNATTASEYGAKEENSDKENGSQNNDQNSDNTNLNIPVGAKEYNKHKYYIYDSTKTWQEAEEYCESLGGHLVTITSKEEQDFIQKLIEEKQYNDSTFWIGANDVEEEGNFKWVTGEKFEYNNWGKGEPDNLTGSQNYAIIQNYKIESEKYTIDKYQWDDIQDNNRMFICEWDGMKVNYNATKNINTKDTTVSGKILPNTGISKIILSMIIIFSVGGIVAFIQYKKFKEIKLK